MNTAAPTIYEITVTGHLDDHLSECFGDVAVQSSDDGTSRVTTSLADRGQLHELLAGLRDLDTHIISLRTTTSPAAPVLTRSLHTSRLTLRPAAITDSDPTWTFRQLPEVNEWLTGCPTTIEGYRELFARPDRLATTVMIELGRPGDGPVIGDFMLRREDAWAQLERTEEAQGTTAELGWVLDPKYAGRGYATEAVVELLRFAFEEVGVRRAVANCFLDNDSSWRLMERVGMRREGHAVGESLHRSGRWLDTLTYALLAEEWISRVRTASTE